MVGRRLPSRGDVYLVALDPTHGHEIRKTRPCLVVSPDDMNQYLRTVIVAPMTTGGYKAPWRVPCRFKRKDGFVAVDQIRTIDTTRLLKRIGTLDSGAAAAALSRLQEMFAP
ncbi:MAG: type II toxin-antitoxin system PemK/MazF family toxin [Vicinamibacterales bacterium]